MHPEQQIDISRVVDGHVDRHMICSRGGGGVVEDRVVTTAFHYGGDSGGG